MHTFLELIVVEGRVDGLPVSLDGLLPLGLAVRVRQIYVFQCIICLLQTHYLAILIYEITRITSLLLAYLTS